MSDGHRFDHTALSDLICEEKFVRKHRDGLAAPGDSAAQACGLAVHAGVRAYYNVANDSEIPLGDIEAATRAAYGEGVNADGADYRTPGLAWAYVKAYMQAYPRPWPFEVLWNEGYIAGADFSGIPDRVVRRKLDGLVYPLDLKTTALWLGAQWQDQWAYSQQAAMQMRLAEEQLGTPVAGFWMDAVYLSSRKAGPQASDFVRCGPFTYSAALRTELLTQVAHDSGRAAALLSGDAVPQMNGPRNGACFAYQRLCRFHRFCRLDPTDRDDAYALALATGELVERRWNPASRDDAATTT